MYRVDSSAYISSDVPPPKEEYKFVDNYGLTSNDKLFVQNFLGMDDSISNNNMERCAQIAKEIRDINGVLHFKGNSPKSYTLLHMAVEKKNLKAVEILLSNGANPDIANGSGKTARDLAQKINDQGILNLIKQKKPSALDEEILSTKTCEVSFSRNHQSSFTMPFNNTPVTTSTYSATYRFGETMKDFVGLDFSISGDCSQPTSLSIQMTVSKVKNQKGNIGYQFVIEGSSTVSKDKISMFTAIPRDFSAYVLSAKKGLIWQKASEEKKEEEPCKVS